MDARMQPVRGARLTLEVSKCIGADQLLKAALTKFAAHDRNFDATSNWTLRYPDGKQVLTLPEGEELFRLDRYHDQVLQDYNRIVLYIAPGM